MLYMEHVGSLENIKKARVSLGYHHGQLLRFFRALQTSHVLHIKHEPIMFITLTVPLSTQVHKRVLTKLLLRGNPAMD